MSDAPNSDAAEHSAEFPREQMRGLVRTSPRYGAFVGTGIAIGAGIGLGVGIGLPGEGVEYRGVVTVLVMVGAAMICGVIAGAIAVLLDGKDPGPVDDSWLDDFDPKGKSTPATFEKPSKGEAD